MPLTTSTHEIRLARPEDIAGMATCHAEAFPGRGTSNMGDEWLRFLYQFYLDADRNVSMVAVGSNGEIDGIAVGGDPKHLQPSIAKRPHGVFRSGLHG